MIPIPAVDLRGGRCVQLVGGDPGDERLSRPDPVAEARRWEDRGARWLHVVDLDRALGEGDNLETVAGILDAVAIPVQVGGGLRSLDDVQELLDLGAARAVVGTRAVTDPAFLREAGHAFGPALAVAVDARGGRVVASGWREGTGRPVLEVAREAEDAGVGALLYTDVGREGRLAGPDLAGVRALAKAVDVPVVASGGVATLEDLRDLAEAGAWGAVVGMALYEGRIDLEEATEMLEHGDPGT